MSEIKRDKGMVEFWVDGKTKPYILDVNKGELLGLRGSALQKIPSVVRSMARNKLSVESNAVMRLVYNGYLRADMYSLADRLDNIGYHPSMWEMEKFFHTMTDFNVGKFAKWLKENPTEDLESYLHSVLRADWEQKIGLKADNLLTNHMIDWIYSNFKGEDVHTTRVIAYWLSRGVWEFFRSDTYIMRARVCDIIVWAKELEWELEKSDFFRQYINFRRAFEQAKEEKANREMREYQEYHRNALTFETETHIVIIPTTIAELRNEGQAQGNCVGGYGSSISNKRCNVVFVRRKSNPDKAYITCDIDRYGYISQYLAHHNYDVRNQEDLAFKELFQTHILANWVR